MRARRLRSSCVMRGPGRETRSKRIRRPTFFTTLSGPILDTARKSLERERRESREDDGDFKSAWECNLEFDSVRPPSALSIAETGERPRATKVGVITSGGCDPP